MCVDHVAAWVSQSVTQSTSGRSDASEMCALWHLPWLQSIKKKHQQEIWTKNNGISHIQIKQQQQQSTSMDVRAHIDDGPAVSYWRAMSCSACWVPAMFSECNVSYSNLSSVGCKPTPRATPHANTCVGCSRPKSHSNQPHSQWWYSSVQDTPINPNVELKCTCVKGGGGGETEL
jgi:hypothetical protein